MFVHLTSKWQLYVFYVSAHSGRTPPLAPMPAGAGFIPPRLTEDAWMDVQHRLCTVVA